MRLDRFLSEMTSFSRSEIKQIVRKGRVRINGQIVKKADIRIDTSSDRVSLDGKEVLWTPFAYYMLNKPAGVVTATHDDHDQTVLDLMKGVQGKDLFPVGRLDKDTEGLLLITNDGKLAHYMLSPSRHVPKIYLARIDQPVTEEDIKMFEEGLRIDDEWTTKPAKLSVIQSGPDVLCEVTICEGRFHQVKRMFEAVGKKVLYLKRTSMGPLVLDEQLKAGHYRPLTEEEKAALTLLIPAEEREDK